MVYLIAFIIIVFDQITKVMVVNSFSLGESRAIINNIFHLTFVKNTGAAFGILAGYRYFFIVITVVVVIALIVFRNMSKKNIFLDIAISLTIGGAIANLIDRIRYGYVIDFLDFRIWPVFNIADSAIVVGMFVLIYYIWKEEANNQVVDSDE
ncbi:signal peptidase II [Natronospora cellulosivora (SeqCode)]